MATPTPWLNIDPIAPARIELAARQHRSQNAAAERRAQLEEQRIFAQQQMMYARLAAQERADQRKEQVLRQTNDARLAQQAAAMEFKRAMAEQQNQRETQKIRIREQQVEQQTSAASRKLFGMRQLQEDMKTMTPEEAIKKNAADLFSDRPERLAGAMKSVQTPAPPLPFTAGGVSGVYNPRTGAPSFPPRGAAEMGPDAYTAREILDQQGNPMGVSAIPGRGSARLLPGHKGLSPEGRVNALKTRLSILQGLINWEATPEQVPALKKEREGIMQQLKEMTDVPERVPGKEDEAVGPDEEEGSLLPPTGDGEEADLEDNLTEDVAMDEGIDDEEAQLEEDF